MSDKEYVLNILKEQGKTDAKMLRTRSPQMDGTELIEEEQKIPIYDPTKDYSGWNAGNPVTDEGQVWVLLQPHNAAHYGGRPSSLRALWGLAHTKNPEKAKPWVDPYGTSGMYMTDECYRSAAGRVFRALQDNLVHDAEAFPTGWAEV